MLKKFHLKHNTNESSEDWISMYGAAQQEVQQVPRLAFTMGKVTSELSEPSQAALPLGA